MIIRVDHRARWTVIANETLEDPEISFQATGLLGYLLSKPDGWEVSYRHLATVKLAGNRPNGSKRRGEGQHAIRMALQELEAVGYIVRQKVRRADGTLRWESVVYERPVASVTDLGIITERDDGAKPLVGPCGGSRGPDERGSEEPGLDSRGSENRGQVTTEGATPEELETEEQGSSFSSKDGVPGSPVDRYPAPEPRDTVSQAIAYARAKTQGSPDGPPPPALFDVDEAAS